LFTATVTVNDNMAPTAVCQNVSVNLNAGGTASVTAAQVNNNSTDNCGTVTLDGVSPSSFGCANLGANTVTLTVSDGERQFTATVFGHRHGERQHGADGPVSEYHGSDSIQRTGNNFRRSGRQWING
jgi:hypothetical protein